MGRFKSRSHARYSARSEDSATRSSSRKMGSRARTRLASRAAGGVVSVMPRESKPVTPPRRLPQLDDRGRPPRSPAGVVARVAQHHTQAAARVDVRRQKARELCDRTALRRRQRRPHRRMPEVARGRPIVARHGIRAGTDRLPAKRASHHGEGRPLGRRAEPAQDAVACKGSTGRTPYDPCQSRYKWLVTPAATHAAIQRHGGGAAPRRAASQRSSNPATAVNPTISTAAPANECVIPRWYSRYAGPDRGVQNGGVTIGSVQSGAFPAIAPSSPAQGMRRSLTARPSAAPTSVWARGSMRPYKVPRPGACNESGAGRVSSRHALLGGRMRRLDLIPVLALVGCAPGGYTRAEVVYAEPARRRRDRARVRQPRAGARGLARPGGGTRSGQARRLDPQRKRRRSHQ